MPARDRGLMHQGRGRPAAEQSARARRIAEDRNRQIEELRRALGFGPTNDDDDNNPKDTA